MIMPPSIEQQFWLAYQMQKRISDKPVGKFEAEPLDGVLITCL